MIRSGEVTIDAICQTESGLMEACLNFIYEKEGEQQKILLHLHEMICTLPGITGKISYGLPFYYLRSWICYLNPRKDGRVELAFPRGNELSNEQGLLAAAGRKQVMGVVFGSASEIPGETVLEILLEAMLLDEEIPYSFRRNKKG